MIHPSLELRMISPEVGYGVFATELIPKGTITYVEDELEVRISEAQFLSYQAPIRAILDKFSYIDAHGDRILSWDFGKYVNHSCDFNSISTGYGFEIAVRDIAAGEQLTDEYGIFNLEQPMECFCGSPKCRGMVGKDDFKRLYPEWDAMILAALPLMHEVAQPLWSLMDEETLKALDDFAKDSSKYRTVFSLYRAPKAVGVESEN